MLLICEDALRIQAPPIDMDGHGPVYEAVSPGDVDRALPVIRASYSSPMGHGATDDELIQFAIVFTARALTLGKPELTGISGAPWKGASSLWVRNPRNSFRFGW